MDDIIWEEPQRQTGRAGKYDDVLTQLRAVSDTPAAKAADGWARIETFDDYKKAYARAAALRQGRIRIPDGEWEFRGSKLDDETGALYARYVGEGEL